MEILTTQDEFDRLSGKALIKLKCLNCSNEFLKAKRHVKYHLKEAKNSGCFCTQKCFSEHKSKLNRFHVNCKNCNASLTRTTHELNKKHNYFCNQSCSAKYFNQFRITELTRLKCANCQKEFDRPNYHLNKNNVHDFCSRKCVSQFHHHEKPVIIKCDNCQKNVIKGASSLKLHKYHFCNKSCQAIYGNKTYNRKQRFGINKSRAETLMVAIIKKDFPNLNIIENDRKTLNGLELDLYIPDKNLGIELNGPCHYIPIFGENELSKTQSKDVIKKETMQKLKIHFFQINIMGAGKKLPEILTRAYDEQIKPLLV